MFKKKKPPEPSTITWDLGDRKAEVLHDGRGGLFIRCRNCNCLVKFNKWLIGGWHLCQ